MLKNSCSAFMAGPSLCRNGFQQNNACSGVGCPTCGNIKDVPQCLRESMPKHLIDDAGLPRFTQIKKEPK